MFTSNQKDCFGSLKAGLSLVSGATSSSIFTTNLIDGRLSGSEVVQRRPMLRTLQISSLKQALSLASITLSTPFCSIVQHTHLTKSFSPNSESTGNLPVTSSRITTPKLYMSLFSVTRSVYAYSEPTTSKQTISTNLLYKQHQVTHLVQCNQRSQQ